MREIRVHPNGDIVAIRSDLPEDDPRAWGYFNGKKGGGWTNSKHVEEWTVLNEPEVESP